MGVEDVVRLRTVQQGIQFQYDLWIMLQWKNDGLDILQRQSKVAEN